MTNLENLTKEIIKFRQQRGWTKGKAIACKNMAIALLLEAAEFLEVFGWTKDNGPPENRREDLQDELIDVLYWVLIIAHDLNINIEKAFRRKMKKNKKKYPVKKK